MSRIAVVDDADLAPFEPTAWSTASVVAGASRTPMRAATIELYLFVACNAQRILLGGVKTPSAEGRLMIAVPSSGDLPNPEDRGAQRAGPLGKPVTAGLPDDYARSVVAGLSAHWSTAGELRVTSAAVDVVGSSPLASQVAAQILAIVLHREADELSDREEAAMLGRLRAFH